MRRERVAFGRRVVAAGDLGLPGEEFLVSLDGGRMNYTQFCQLSELAPALCTERSLS